MRTDDFDYHLPQELIAQHPRTKRDQARLLVSLSEGISHHIFSKLPDFLRPGDLLVFNDTRVLSARLFGSKIPTGARIEIFLLKQISSTEWQSLLRPLRKVQEGTWLKINNGLTAHVKSIIPNEGTVVLKFSKTFNARTLEKHGSPPLPPYIKRDYNTYSSNEKRKDSRMYQTVYAKNYGSVASPTAGLHFTRPLMRKLRAKGILMTSVTLDISLGTFKPVQSENIQDHIMHTETYRVSPEAAEMINNRSGRLIAVGTTSLRVLETVMDQTGSVQTGQGSTDIFIHPPYRIRSADMLITNFHLPKSTLLMLIASFIGMERMKEIYETAVKGKYRFYSFGDAMLLKKSN